MAQKIPFLSDKNIKYFYDRTGGDKYIIYKYENNYFATFDYKKIYIISVNEKGYYYNKELKKKFPILSNFKCQFTLQMPINFLIIVKDKNEQSRTYY